MKIKITQEMKEKIFIGSVIVTLALLLYFFMVHFSSVAAFWKQVTSILSAFIFGFGFAFLLNPIMMAIENKIFTNWNHSSKRVLSLLIAFLITILVVGSLSILIIQSTLDSIKDLVDNYQLYIEEFTVLLTSFIKNQGLDENWINSIIGTSDQILETLTIGIPSILSTSYSIVGVFINILIGTVSGLYLLLDKEKLIRHVKKLTYAVFPEEKAMYMGRFANNAQRIFNNFIVGKAIDSLIIGIICYIGLTLLNIEYAALFSFIIGMTNMIPVFGPFIGAIPGIFILLIMDPGQCLTFIIFVIILQQFDGNILGPLILGDKLGLPSFWILFSVTIGGSLFGIVGMFLGVPVFALFYFTVKEFANIRLEKKKLTDII